MTKFNQLKPETQQIMQTMYDQFIGHPFFDLRKLLGIAPGTDIQMSDDPVHVKYYELQGHLIRDALNCLLIIHAGDPGAEIPSPVETPDDLMDLHTAASTILASRRGEEETKQ